ncbi:MAG: hypothetical protein GF332_02715 [Candidatus Moranbacteria bacterium]|nr:hypothetical protein [Candidatus Moranbacteria bacterium]
MSAQQRGYVFETAQNHYNSPRYPADISNEQAFIPTGMYLGWLIERGLVSDYFLNETQNELNLFSQGRITAPKIFKSWGGILSQAMLKPQAHDFSRVYFSNRLNEPGKYYHDYKKLLGPNLSSIFSIPDTWENYQAVKTMLDQRFKQYQKANRKPWWKFW